MYAEDRMAFPSTELSLKTVCEAYGVTTAPYSMNILRGKKYYTAAGVETTIPATGPIVLGDFRGKRSTPPFSTGTLGNWSQSDKTGGVTPIIATAEITNISYKYLDSKIREMTFTTNGNIQLTYIPPALGNYYSIEDYTGRLQIYVDGNTLPFVNIFSDVFFSDSGRPPMNPNDFTKRVHTYTYTFNARSVKINFSFQATDSSGIPNRSTARIENTYECTSPGISEPPIFLYANGVQTTH